MSFGEGNLRERVDELERENAELKSLVRDFNEIAAAAYMLPGTVNYDTLLPLRERVADLGIETESRES